MVILAKSIFMFLHFRPVIINDKFIKRLLRYVPNVRSGVAKCIGGPILCKDIGPIFDRSHFVEPLGEQIIIEIGTELHMGSI